LIAEVLQSHSVQHVRDSSGYLLPEAAGHAAFGPLASGLAAGGDAVDQGNGALRRPDDVAHSDLGRGPRQAIASGGAFHPLDQPGPLQFAEQLGDVGGGDALAAGNIGPGDGTLPSVEGNVHHRPHRVSALGGKSHGAPDYSIVEYFCQQMSSLQKLIPENAESAEIFLDNALRALRSLR